MWKEKSVQQTVLKQLAMKMFSRRKCSYFNDLWIGKDFLDNSQKEITIKEKSIK